MILNNGHERAALKDVIARQREWREVYLKQTGHLAALRYLEAKDFSAKLNRYGWHCGLFGLGVGFVLGIMLGLLYGLTNAPS